MKQTFLRSTTSDNLILQGLLSEPDILTGNLILHVHGMAGNFYENRFVDAMTKVYTEKGYSFLSINTRGHDFIADFSVAGDKEEYKRIGNFREVFEDCVLDIAAWVDTAEKRGYKNIILQGHSLGSVKVVYYQAKKNDKRIKKLVLASPPDMIGLTEADKNHKNNFMLAKKMVTEGKGDEILPTVLWDWSYLSAKTYVDFGTRDKPIDIFNTYDKARPSLLSKIKLPTFAFFGSNDDAAILPKTEALQVIKSKATNCPRFDTTIIEGAPHSYFGHEEDVADTVIKWLVS